MPGRSSVEAIHLIRSLMEKYMERQRDLHLAFLDLEKAYDSVPQELIWKTLIDKGTSRRYIKVIRDMYDGAKTRVRTSTGSRERIDEDVSHRIKTTWLKWRAAIGVLCDRNIYLKLKGKFHRVAIRTFMLYGLEYWPITKALANRMEVVKLRMLRRRPHSAPVRRVEALVFDGLRRRGKPKLRWEDIVKHDMKELLLSNDMTSDRNEWRARISLGDSKVVRLLHFFNRRKKVIPFMFLYASISRSFFVELHVSTHYHFPCDRIIKLVAFRLIVVTNEHMLLASIINLGLPSAQCRRRRHMAAPDWPAATGAVTGATGQRRPTMANHHTTIVAPPPNHRSSAAGYRSTTNQRWSTAADVATSQHPRQQVYLNAKGFKMAKKFKQERFKIERPVPLDSFFHALSNGVIK
uniref:Retrovirus-related Pol polyprotein LINE-1 n=1 Tax=Tanacetum cinerariifolium TaxID=118510 RepID=A0A6L2M660_TANCI|nr:retrovirus-related Pol polyprotein LINE-1 [Tanacetum cinerariifolium]